MTSAGISTRYAQALVDALSAGDAGADASAALDSLHELLGTLKDSRDLELVLLSPSVSPPRKRAVLGRVAEGMQLPRLVRNFLLVLSDHRRLPLLREIAETARVLLDARQGVLRADVSTAEPLSDDEQRKIAEKLGQITGRRIRIEMKIDPGLIGGVVARVGSTVYDGSVRGRLQSLGERLAAESR